MYFWLNKCSLGEQEAFFINIKKNQTNANFWTGAQRGFAKQLLRCLKWSGCCRFMLGGLNQKIPVCLRPHGFYSFSQLLWLNSQISFSFIETIISDHWTIRFLFTSDCNFLLIWANCKCFGTCVQKVSTIVCSLRNNQLHMACCLKLMSWFSLKLSNSSQLFNHFSSCKSLHSKRSIPLSNIGVHACILHKYLTLTLFVMSAKLANDL